MYVCGVIMSVSKGLKSYAHALALLGKDRQQPIVNTCTLGISELKNNQLFNKELKIDHN